MKRSYLQTALQTGVLGVGGMVAIGFGGAILLMPETFYASYGIELSNDASRLSEIRAPGGALLGLGLVIVSGAIWSRLTFASIIASSAVYLSYGLSRVFSIALDGVPDGGLLAAAAFELALGVISLVALWRHRREAGLKTS